MGGSALQFGIRIFKSEKEETVIGYDRQKQEVFVDRSVSGNVSFHPDFAGVERAPAALVNGKLKLHIFVDHSIVEVFVNDGEQVITDQVFPVDSLHTVELFSAGGEASVNVKGWLLRSTWE
jgi:fructan beta-fructosidase